MFARGCHVLINNNRREGEKIEYRLVNRDYTIMQEIDRWRVCLSRHIKLLSGFQSQRSCDRRLKKLTEMKYIYRKKVLYGIPSIWFLTSKGKSMISSSNHIKKVRLEQVIHDIVVLDTAIYFHQDKKIPFTNMKTEKELHSLAGFANRTHKPDFIFTTEEKTSCVEVELTLKAKNRIEKNVKDNFIDYETQYWVIPSSQPKIQKILTEFSQIYPNVNMMLAEKVNSIVK